MDTKNLYDLALGVTGAVWHKLYLKYPRIGAQPKVTLNNRLTKTAGKMYVVERDMHLSTKLFHYHQDEFIKVIIPHELIHMVDYDLYGLPKRWHRDSWKQLMIEYGLPPDLYHEMRIPK